MMLVGVVGVHRISLIALSGALLTAAPVGVAHRPPHGAAERRAVRDVLWDQAHYWADRLFITRARDWAFVRAVVNYHSGPRKGKAERMAEFLLRKQGEA